MSELNVLPISNIDYIAGYEKLPEAWHQDYDNVLQLVANEQYDKAEMICRSVLARYDDSDTGFFREELAAIYHGRDDISGARKILRQVIAKEPACADRAHLSLARIAFFNDQHRECLKELDAIGNPVKDVYAEMIHLRAGSLLELEGITPAAEVLREGIETIKNGDYEPAIKDFFAVRLFGFLMMWDMDEFMPEYLADDVSLFTEYLEDVPGTKGLDYYILSQLAPVIEGMLGNLMYRGLFEEIITALEENNRLNDEPDAADGLRGALESHEAGEDETVDQIVLQFVSCASAPNASPKEKAEIYWLAAKKYLEQPKEFEDFRFVYPYFFKEAEAEFEKIKADPEGIMKQSAKEYAEASGISAERAETQLNRTYEVENHYDFEVAEITWEELEQNYPRGVHESILRARYAFHREEYEMVPGFVVDILNTLNRPDAYLEYMLIVSEARLGDERDAAKHLKRMKKDFPDAMHTALAEGIVLEEKARLKQAEKVLAPLIPTTEDPYALLEEYKTVLDLLKRSGQVRNVILKQMQVTEAEDPKPGSKRSFLVCAWLMLAETDIIRKDSANLKKDIEHLKDYLSNHPVNSLEEFRLSFWVTRFCTAVQMMDFGLQEFIDLIHWCDEHDIFADQNPLIDSAHAAYESALAYDDDELDDHLFDFVSMGRNPNDESEPAEFAEAFWRAAESVRRDPECAGYMKEHYPNFIGPMMNDINEMIEDPEAAKHLAEEMLSNFTGQSPEEIRAMMNLSMGNIGDDFDKRRFS